MLNIKQDFITKDPIKRPGHKLDWTTITVHNTANEKSTAENERAWLSNPTNKRQASWHYVVHEGTIIQAIPDTEVAWHATDGANGPGNRTSISIEVCEEGNFELSKQTAAKLIAQLLKSKNLPITAVKKHADWTNKNCPRLLIPVWPQFLEMIQKELAPVPSLWENELDQATKFVRAMNISDGSNPEGTLTRGQLFVMLHRFFQKLH